MRFSSKNKILLGVFSLLILSTHKVYGITSEKLSDYRVRIHSTSSSSTIRVNNGYNLYSDGVKIDYLPTASGEDFVLTKTSDGVRLNNSKGVLVDKAKEIKFVKKDDSTRYFEVKGIDGKDYAKYPDNLLVRLDSKKSNLLVINSTPLETYLKGVIPHEMGANAPLEAMKAQAVTARTLAVKRVNKNSIDGYDITNTTSDQVYKGYDSTYFSSSHNVSKAVEGTKGIVLTYNGSLVEGLYYSNNGGYTASDGFVWSSGNSTPYYNSKVDEFDTYAHKSTAGWAKITYSEEYSKEQLRKIILDNSSKYATYFKEPYCTPSFSGLGVDYNVEILKQTNGYVTQVRLSDNEGRSYLIKNYANRWVFGLRSQQYKLSKVGGIFIQSNNKTSEKDTIYVEGANGNKKAIKKDELYVQGASGTRRGSDVKYIFNGKGYGHGIGMSQNGAMNRAEAGHNYTQILSFYYTGTKTVSNYNR